jgi:hypothetical protein
MRRWMTAPQQPALLRRGCRVGNDLRENVCRIEQKCGGFWVIIAAVRWPVAFNSSATS